MEDTTILSISSSIKFEADNITFNDRCAIFDMSWYLVTATASIIKLIYLPSEDFSDAILFVILFAIPICFKHILAFDIYKGMRQSKSGTILFNTVNHSMNVLFFISFFLLTLFGFISSVFVYGKFGQYIMVLLHVVITVIGIYDRITVKLNPKFELKGEGVDD